MLPSVRYPIAVFANKKDTNYIVGFYDVIKDVNIRVVTDERGGVSIIRKKYDHHKIIPDEKALKSELLKKMPKRRNFLLKHLENK